MNRDDLRHVVRELVDDARADYMVTALTRPVSDAELAEMGYVKVGETVTEETWTIVDEVDEADLLAQGYAKLPDCEACEGEGTSTWDKRLAPVPCPSCGGSGFGRLVAAGADFDEHRLDTVARNLGYIKLDGIDVDHWIRYCRGVLDGYIAAIAVHRDQCKALLAAIDQEATDAS